MRVAFRKTIAGMALASCAFACACGREAAQTRAASPVASGEDGGPVVRSPSPLPSSFVATPDVTPDAEAPPSRLASADEPSDASVGGRSLQDQLRAATASSPAASTAKAFGCFGTDPFGGVSLQSCKRPGGPTGSGHVVITVAATGEVRSVVVDVSPFAGTAVGDCIAEQFRKVRVPPFAGGDVKIGKVFSIN